MVNYINHFQKLLNYQRLDDPIYYKNSVINFLKIGLSWEKASQYNIDINQYHREVFGLFYESFPENKEYNKNLFFKKEEQKKINQFLDMKIEGVVKIPNFALQYHYSDDVEQKDQLSKVNR